MSEALLEIRGLKTHFACDDGMIQAVDDVDLRVESGETVCLVGESGCGKTVTALSVLKLIAMPPARIVQGQILWRGSDLVKVDVARMSRLRGKEIAMVFQEPMTALNPVYTVGEQIAEAIRLHGSISNREAFDKTIEMLRLVHIPNPEKPAAFGKKKTAAGGHRRSRWPPGAKRRAYANFKAASGDNPPGFPQTPFPRQFFYQKQTLRRRRKNE